MLSGVGPGDHLNELGIPVLLDLPVGNNYQNHPGFFFIEQKLPSLGAKITEELFLRKSGPLSEVPFLISFLSTDSNVEKDWPNVCIMSYMATDNKLGNLMYLTRIRSIGRVRLQSSDPRMATLIDPNIFSDPRDYSDFFNATKFLFYLSQHPSLISDMSVPSLESVGCPSCPGKENYLCDEGIDCFIRKFANQMAHFSGTCRMGAVDRDDVVVDPQLRLKYAKNLRVCDASIYPLLPNGNGYAPAAMVGEKCAQMIKDFHEI